MSINLFLQRHSLQCIPETGNSEGIALDHPLSANSNKTRIHTFFKKRESRRVINLTLGFEFTIMKSCVIPSPLKKRELKSILKQLNDPSIFFTYHTLNSYNNQHMLVTLSINKIELNQIIRLCRQCNFKINTLTAEPLLAIAALPKEDRPQLLLICRKHKKILCLCKDKQLLLCQTLEKKSLSDACQTYKSAHPQLKQLWVISDKNLESTEQKALASLEIETTPLNIKAQHEAR